jgi:hypothetical protein
MPKARLALILPIALIAAGNGRAGLRCEAGEHAVAVVGSQRGTMHCVYSNATFRRIGTTDVGHLTLYDYRYRTRHAGGTYHGNHRLVVFDRSGYVGTYSLPLFTGPDLALNGSILRLRNAETGETAAVDFRNGPPKSIYFDGEVNGFGR